MLDKILEKDMGSAVLVGFASPTTLDWLRSCNCAFLFSDDVGRSRDPFIFEA